MKKDIISRTKKIFLLEGPNHWIINSLSLIPEYSARDRQIFLVVQLILEAEVG